MQVASTQLLAKLLEAPNTSATAKKHVSEINEEFFMVASTYMDMVRAVVLQNHTPNSIANLVAECVTPCSRPKRRGTQKFAQSWRLSSKLPWLRSRKLLDQKFSY